MEDQFIARRYAAALYAEAARLDALEATAAGLEAVARAVAATPLLRAVLNQPVVTAARKKEALATVFATGVPAPLPNFLNLLVDKRRIELLPGIQAELARMVRSHKNVELAAATTAVPLSETETAALKVSLETRTGKTIELNTHVDPAVLGGVLVRIGDTVYDGTVRGNLERLREQLLTRR